MLTHVIHWIEMVGTGVDGLLLLRVLSLKLHRIYAFLTLFCALELLFDIADWILGWDSRPTELLVIYSLFLYAVLFPLMGWDVFEELPKQVLKLRRLFGARLVTGVIVSAIFGLLVYATFEDSDASGSSLLPGATGMVLWTGSISATMAFVWSFYRLLGKQKIATPHNTAVWARFFLLYLLSSILYFASVFFTRSIPEVARNIIIIIFLVFDVGITIWCSARLRALPSSDAPATETAG